MTHCGRGTHSIAAKFMAPGNAKSDYLFQLLNVFPENNMLMPDPLYLRHRDLGIGVGTGRLGKWGFMGVNGNNV